MVQAKTYRSNTEYENFTPFKFYTDFLPQLKKYYSENTDKTPPVFSFSEFSYIDSSCLPLLISLGNSLKQYHKKPIPLSLNNVPGTNSNRLINYLDQSDFFSLTGDSANLLFPQGRNIFDFDTRMLGWNVSHLTIRKEHKVKGYSLRDLKLNGFKELPEDVQRDKLIEHFSFVVDTDFDDVFYDNQITSENRYQYIDILSELITNSLIHSDSDCFISFHTDKFKTAISISDTGIGFFNSLQKKKTQSTLYQSLELTNALHKVSVLKLQGNVENNLYSIFEALYFSCLKDRRGLFDLLCSIVVDGHGIFRIHNYSVQLIISSKLENELLELYRLRESIYKNLVLLKDKQDKDTKVPSLLKSQSESVKQSFIRLFTKILRSYSNDIQYSPVRFFDIEFKGVHIEAEIPRS
jgi:hypothetical protein